LEHMMLITRKKPETHPALHNQRGFSIFEFGLVMILLAPLLVFAMKQMAEATNTETNRAAASHQTMIATALQRYQKENAAAILASTASGPQTISLAMLRATGDLPASISDRNPYNQTYVAGARRSTANGQPIVEIMLTTTGGTDIPEKSLRDIAGQVQGGGYVSHQAAATAKGAAGTWEIAMAPFGLSPGAGHLVTAMFFNDAGLIADYLYRNLVPGHPELNTMNTTLNMGTNDIGNARNVSAQTVTATDSVTAGNTLAIQAADGSRYGGWYMADNTWLRSINDKSLYTGGSVLAGGTVSGADVTATNTVSGTNVQASNQVYAQNSIVTPGQLIAGAITSNSTITAGSRLTAGEYVQVNGTAAVGAGCGPAGLIGQDGTGALLQCEQGIWRKTGGISTVQARTASTSGTRHVSADAFCIPPEKVVGGGGACTNGGFSWLAYSFPQGNGWSSTCDATSDRAVSVTTYAMCAN
jgi:type II secretory pathway pseudopilin PulG